jgi:hypothetical protein
MTKNFTQWLQASFLTPSEKLPVPAGETKTPFCSGNKATCFEHLFDLLGGELSEENEQKMMANIEACRPCYEEFDVQLAIQQAVKLKVHEIQVPEGLIDDIRSKITALA